MKTDCKEVRNTLGMLGRITKTDAAAEDESLNVEIRGDAREFVLQLKRLVPDHSTETIVDLMIHYAALSIPGFDGTYGKANS